MYRKLRVKMTLFCTAVTGIILLFMTLAGLLAFKNLLDTNDRTSYEKDVDSVLAYLENEEVIDYEKISAAANPRFYTINLYENKICYSYDPEKEKQELMEEICRKAKEIYGFDVSALSAAKGISKLLEFSMKYKGTDHLVTFAAVPHQFGTFCTVISYSRETLKRQFLYLYVVFAVIDGAALLLLFLFSWVYTGKMLYPIEKNRAQQMQFVAAASHELRSPLAVLLSDADALAVADEEDRPGFQEMIQAEGQRMSRLIQDMLTLAGADNQSWSVHYEKISLDTMIPEVYEKYHILAEKKGLHLQISLPPCEEESEVFCDGQRLEQVLGILLDNAVSYTPEGGTIFLGYAREGSKWKLWVGDTGPGIPDPWKERVFERFFRGDASRKEKKHFGLGLSIAGEIVRLHKGKIWVEDRDGGGTVFYFTIPGC
ncbi:HAMP domain-containing sensor histidine kinase [Blautia coccoides]|uniref:sensor histidine kinase n=1 Tax=Blautia producta TaxID=33035 RepID=UPI0028A3CE24|nr:HAMP domain-containing sensor histidine kinase [Blautia coccoides]MDT4372312.1 HAMP domain-containing sensor histidine kinase [Blautia coccoides]